MIIALIVLLVLTGIVGIGISLAAYRYNWDDTERQEDTPCN